MMGELIRVSGRTPDVAEFLREAMLSQRFADVALCCPGGQRFLAHRLVLSAASPYLQEVLLAHSKSAGGLTCEPITVILAEVEGPELAAILGLIYTGNAAIARPRLDAFLRAAQTLRVKLPPLPEMMTCTEDCKPEDIKDVKLNTTYLQCDQYPHLLPYRGWFQEHEANIESYNSYHLRKNGDIKIHESSENLKMHPRNGELRDTDTRYGLHGSSDIGDGEKSNNIITRNMEDLKSRRSVTEVVGVPAAVDESPDAEITAMNLCKISTNVEANRKIEIENENDGVSRNLRFSDRRVHLQGIENVQQQSNCFVNYSTSQRSFDKRRGSLTETSPSLTTLSREIRRPSPIESKDNFSLGIGEQRVNVSDNRNYEAPSKILESLFDLRVPSLHQSGHLETPTTTEKFNYIQSEQNLVCRESCCRWRPPRKHVANQVTASPWRQLTRPHHSPKIKSMIVQNQQTADNNCEPNGRLQRLLSTEVTRMDTMAPTGCQNVINEQFSLPVGSSSSLNHGFDVPNAANVAYPNDIEMLRLKERKLQEFYRAQMLFPGPQPIRPSPVSFGVTQNYYPSQDSPPTLPPPTVVPMHPNTLPVLPIGTPITLQNMPTHPTATEIAGQNCLPPSCKPELSHPVSRLCDSTRSTEPQINHNTNLEEDPRILCTLGEKTNETIAQLSDSNNNNPSAGDGSQNRGTSGPGSVTSDDHKCDQCGKSFVTRASLKVHARTHSGEKPFQCSDCGKQFSQLRNYKYHRSVHEGTREFAATCPECGKYFNDRGYLSSHMKIHRNRKEYACGECGKSFNQRVAYNMHVRIHTGVKPHQCEQCGKAFSRKMLLKQHLRTHSGERPYQCQVCHKAFADRSNMTLHTRLHSGLKPYQCTLCSKAFTKKHHLKTHLNYHTGTKPYSCPNCGLRFSQSSNMRTHFKKCAVNNPNSNQIGSNGDRTNGQGSREIEVLTTLNTVGPRTPSAALTPPNSDQESSVLPPLSSRNLPPEMTKS